MAAQAAASMLSMHCQAHKCHCCTSEHLVRTHPLPPPPPRATSRAFRDVALPAGSGRGPALPHQRACLVAWRLRWRHDPLTGGPTACQWGGGRIDQLQPGKCPSLHALHYVCLQSVSSLWPVTAGGWPDISAVCGSTTWLQELPMIQCCMMPSDIPASKALPTLLLT